MVLILGLVAERLKAPALLSQDMEIVLRTHSDNELQLRRKDGIGTVFNGEEQRARGMTGRILQRFDPQAARSAQSTPHHA